MEEYCELLSQFLWIGVDLEEAYNRNDLLECNELRVVFFNFIGPLDPYFSKELYENIAYFFFVFSLPVIDFINSQLLKPLIALWEVPSHQIFDLIIDITVKIEECYCF